MKKNNIKIYAQALAEVAMSKKENKKSVDNFLALVKKNSLERKLKEIVVLAEKIILEKQGKKNIVFQTARKVTLAQKKLLTGVAKEGDVIKETISPELIAGVKVVVNENKQLDMSMQKKLQEIFK